MSGSDKRQRHVKRTIRLSDAELGQLDAAAGRAGLSVGAYIRLVVIGAKPPRQSRRPPVERAELAQILGHVGKLGSNVNQLTKYANMGREVDNPALAQAAADIAAIRRALLSALGRDKRAKPRKAEKEPPA